MALGYGKPLYLLAFDHRGSFEREAVHEVAARHLETANRFAV
jgi:hypothetical protein